MVTSKFSFLSLTLLLIFFLSGCSSSMVSKEDFNKSISLVNDKLDTITYEQRKLSGLKEEVEVISAQLDYIELIAKSGINVTELRELQLQMNELKELVASSGNPSATSTELFGTVETRLDELLNSSINSLFINRELDDLLNRISDLERNNQNQYNDLLQRLSSFKSGENGDLNSKSYVSIDLFMGEISDIRSRLGKEAYDSFEIEEMGIEYQIRPGDSLWTIAKAYGISVEAIKAANEEIPDSNLIHIGDSVIIPLSLDNMLASNSVASHMGLKPDLNIMIDSIESTFGSYDNGYANPGMDFSVPAACVIKSILPGKVVKSEKLNDTYGETVIIDSGNGIRTWFSKLDSRLVFEGEFVSSGDSIGVTANKKDNLHFEIWKDNVPINPADVIFDNMGIFNVTMYTEWDDGKNPTSPVFKQGSSGNYVKSFKTIAADTTVIPAGSVVYIPFFSSSPNKGFFVVEDTGNGIKGKRIDVYTNDIDVASKFHEELLVYVVEK